MAEDTEGAGIVSGDEADNGDMVITQDEEEIDAFLFERDDASDPEDPEQEVFAPVIITLNNAMLTTFDAGLIARDATGVLVITRNDGPMGDEGSSVFLPYSSIQSIRKPE